MNKATMSHRSMPRRASLVRGAFALALLAGLATPTLAQVKKQVNPFQGFSGESGQPVDVTSETLEVYQNEQKAVFIGNVVATQGDSVLRSPRLTIFYDNANAATAAGQTPAAGAAAQPAPAQPTPAQPAPAPQAAATPAAGDAGQASAIKRLEATGGGVVTSADQKATGADGVFDMASNTATLTGNVVLTQGPNIIKGKKLIVDLKTGVARVSGGTTGLFVPNSAPKPSGN